MYKIGILNNTQALRSGGLFHYIMSLIEGFRKYCDFEIVVFYDDPEFQKFIFDSPYFKWVFIRSNENFIAKVVRSSSTLLNISSPLLGRYKPLLDEKIDLLICLDSMIGFHLNLPFLNFTGDVMYKYYPDLSEYTLKARVIRDLVVKRATKHSVFTVVDSQECKKDLIKFFKLKEGKIRPISLCAPPHIYKYKKMDEPDIQEIVNKYHIPDRFIFYPAQFWSHKNHIRLIESLDLLRKQYDIEIPAIFVGSAWESADRVNNLIRELRMDDQIHCLGYLAEKEVAALYKKATALVFASFADYTSIPVLEAMVLGTPIICSNLFSMPEQVGDAALLFDPFSVEDMAEKIYALWNNEPLRTELITKGYNRVAELSLENFSNKWKELIFEALEYGMNPP